MLQTSAKHLFSSKVILPPKQLCTGKKTGFHRFEKMPPKRFRLGNFFEFHAKKTFRDESTPDNVMKKSGPEVKKYVFSMSEITFWSLYPF